jgi:N-acyl homoserine lactone hydrolase
VLPGVTAHAAPGHTPGHLVFVAAGRTRDAIFTGDAAKNRAELLARRADATYDAALSRATITAIWQLWERRPGSIVVPGHDLPMIQDQGRTRYLGERDAALRVWVGDDLETTKLVRLAL